MNRYDEISVLNLIGEYECSVLKEPKDRITCGDTKGRYHFIEGDYLARYYVSYAKKCREYLRFGKEVDAVIAGTYAACNTVKICETPKVLLDAGFSQRPMLYTQKHLKEAMKPKGSDYPHRHNFSLEQIKQFSEWIQKPVLIADNPSRDDAVLMVLPAVDDERLPIVASIKPKGLGNYELAEIETNMILTVFGKERFEGYFKNVLTQDKILYFDNKKGQELERLSGRQLPGDYFKLILNVIIRQPRCFVNPKTQKKSQKKVPQPENIPKL